jgi:tripartite ATP-independent transporter DctM subunit
MDPLAMGIIAIIILLALLAVGVHVAIAIGIVAFVGLISIGDLERALSLTGHSFYTTTSNYAFTVLPLFILMGHFAASSGVVEKAYNFVSRWLSHLPAGLYLVTTGSCALFAAATGSMAATTVAVGKTVLPEMQRLGYDRRLSVATVAASGTLGVLIPPSVPLVIYGICTEESIGRLLLAGLIPGVVSAVIYMLGISLLVRFKPSLAPERVKYKWKERFQSIPGVWGVALLFGVVMGGIYSGVFTPNEAGAIGASAAIVLLAFRTKKDFFREATRAAWETALTTAMIFFIIMTATVFSYFLTWAGVVKGVMSFIVTGGFSPFIILGFFLLIWLFLGMFMAATPVLILVAPLAHSVLIPLGFDGIWLGIIMIKMMEVAFITPPIGTGVFVAKALVPDLSLEEVFKGIAIFVVMDLLTIAILVTFPQISLWLPTIAFGS